MSVRNKEVADGFSKSLSISEPRNGKLLMCVDGEEEEVCPGKMSGGKTPLLQIRDDRHFHVMCIP